MSAAYDTLVPGNNFRNCSGHSEFCFFCQFGPQTTNTKTDMASELRDIVRSMAGNHCEVSQIARRVLTVYEEDVRQTIVYETEDNDIIQAPEWSLASITRHILHSAEFSLFAGILDSCFQSILMNLQSGIFSDDNECDPERLEQFLKTAKTYTTYQSAMKRENGGSKRQRNA